MTTEKIVCAVCEKRPSIRWEGIDICLVCFNRGRTAMTVPGPVVVSLTPSTDELLIRDSQLRVSLRRARQSP
jgi:hypothetical protein